MSAEIVDLAERRRLKAAESQRNGPTAHQDWQASAEFFASAFDPDRPDKPCDSE